MIRYKLKYIDMLYCAGFTTHKHYYTQVYLNFPGLIKEIIGIF